MKTANTITTIEPAYEVQWYPCNEMLPLDGERVLMAWVRRPGKDHTMRTGWHGPNGWRGSGDIKFRTEPTHWRALPVLDVPNTKDQQAREARG